MEAFKSALQSIILFSGLFLFSSPLKAEVSYHFQYLTIDQGLPQNTVNSILHDQHGFMWFATGNGLSKYDGYSFKNYWKPDLPSNLVNALAESADDIIWIGTSQGLVCYHQKTGRFSPFQLPVEPNSRLNIVSLFADDDDRIWVGTYEHGLFLLTLEGETYTITNFNTANSQLPGNHVSSFLKMKDGRILIGTNHGIGIANKQRKDIHLLTQGNLENALVLSLFESMEGDLWVGTYNGIWVYNPTTGRDEWFQHNPLDNTSINHNRINEITQDFRGNIYIGTLGGVNIYQPHSHSFEAIPYNTVNEFSLNSMFIKCIELDQEGNVWIGTEKGGVNHFNLFQKPFHHIVHQTNNPNSLTNNTVNSIMTDSKDVIWIGTAGGGLNQYNRKTGQFKHYFHEPGNPRSLPSDYITAVTKIPHSAIWVGTWGGGICKMLPDGTFQTFIPPSVNADTDYQNSFISSLLYDERGYLFIGTEGGLAILNVQTETFLNLNQNSHALAQIREVGCLLKDRNNHLWVGTRNGLFTFPVSDLNLPYQADSPANPITVFKSGTSINNEKGLPGDYIISLMEDSQGHIWIGTYGDGLVKARKTTTGDYEFTQYSKEEGLSNHVIYAIQQDDAGYLWVSTDYGLSQINPENNTIDNFFSDDGLLSDQFYWSASHKSESGELFFGSVNGVNHFYPSSFPVYPHEPSVAITALKIFNNPVQPGSKRYGKVVFDKSLQHVEEISLSFKDNIFSIEFSALDYFLARKIKYAYQMVDIDRDWVEVSADHRSASYTNLKGGTYRFRIKASNSEGVWSPNEKQLLITIRPPFWQTTWFLILLILTIMAGTIMYIRHHTRRLLLEKNKLEKLVSERTRRIEEQNQHMHEQAETLKHINTTLQKKSEEIEGQKKELEAKNGEIMLQHDRLITLNKEIESINQTRLKFFTNISHEFRTPLTLIISPVERLLKEMHLPGMAHELLTSVQRNARRLNLLIDQLLMFRKIETGNLSIRISNNDLQGFIEEIFHAFDILARQKNISYSKIVALDEGPYWYDGEKLENILYNLLSNAFKYTPEGGAISLLVKEHAPNQAEQAKPSLSIEVGDTGLGIHEEQMDKIFNRFYRTATGGTTKGSGIGLSLTRELVEAMNGTVVVAKNGQKGSRFIVTLPYRKEDFEGAEINELPVYDVHEMTNKIQVVLDNMKDEEPFMDGIHKEYSEEAKVLIVEDNKELALFIANSLSGQYHVMIAENGKTGYEMARKNAPDLILSDVMMPEMNGIDMCRHIKSNLYTSHIPVILLSAKALLEDQLEGFQIGADDYISKPFNLDILKAKVFNAIEARRKIRTLFASESELPKTHSNGESLDDKFLAKAYDVLEKSHSNPEFSVELFSDSMFVSRSLLYKKLKALADLSPNDFITIYRLKKSLPLLSSKELSVNEVAYTVGFNDPKYFSRVFKKFYQKKPSEYAI
jgi:ligand-binding sensor domain-containing protein/signal transduction histidine kinase/AraC-like DNA-binding protein